MGRKSEHLTDASGSTVEVYGPEPIRTARPWAARVGGPLASDPLIERNTRMHSTLPRATRTLGTVAAALALSLGTAATSTAAPAQVPAASRTAASSDTGLYGAADPTFDGVYRQGLAIIGLRAVKASVPTSAVSWLVRQQCPNGGFQAYRADAAAACDAPNPATFSGPDSNSTALAAMALRSVGRTTQATRATSYLRSLQNSDGGFAYYKGGSSDVNSTGLAMSALRPQAGSTAVAKRLVRASKYLRAAQFRCSAPAADQGLLPYQPAGPANSLASAQAALGLTTSLPARVRQVSSERLTCRDGKQVGSVSTRNALLAGISTTLRAGKGTAPSSVGSGPDISATAQMAIALAGTRQYPGTVRTAVRALKTNAAEYTGTAADPNPAALGTLLQVAAVTANTTPSSFGGV
ncbi:MAG TPA: prenyltransferase/squalene oxidase repeat-containing protein, partial [Dermatophilaceae bacterium]|nr:prenyltransferase/squalene oxidase repeat-containing protein [Dermatophilaceae bacterium]